MAGRYGSGSQGGTPAQLYDGLRKSGPQTLDQMFSAAFGFPFDEHVVASTAPNNFLAAVNDAVRIGLVTASPEWLLHPSVASSEEHTAHYLRLGQTVLTPNPDAQRLFNGLGFSFSKLAQLKGRPIIVAPAYDGSQYWRPSAEVFCIFPFRRPHDPFFAKVVKPAIEEMGLSVQLAAEHRSSSFIAEEIFNSIMASRIVVADCTGANPNVLYEIGLAHAVGKPVILLTRHERDIPFDLRHIRHLTLKRFSRGGLPLAELKQALAEQIEPAVAPESQPQVGAQA